MAEHPASLLVSGHELHLDVGIYQRCIGPWHVWVAPHSSGSWTTGASASGRQRAHYFILSCVNPRKSIEDARLDAERLVELLGLQKMVSS